MVLTRRQALASLALAAGMGCALSRARAQSLDVKDWILRPDQPAINVPLDYLGLHSDHGIGLVREVPPSFGYDAIRSHDVDNGRDHSATQWADVEYEPGKYNWRFVDKWIAAHGDRTRIWVLFGTPRFYQKYPREAFPYPYLSGGGSPPADPETAARFIAALLERHPSKINFVELWNEPDHGPEGDASNGRWTPDVAKAKGEPGWFTGSASDLAAMARAIRRVLPDGVKLLASGWVNQDQPGPANSLLRFASAPDGAGGCGRDHVQALSVHAYTSNYQPNDNIDLLRRYEERFAEAGFAKDLPKYVTETGAEGDGIWTAEFPPMADKVTSILRWGMIPAAMGYRGVYYYHHSKMRQIGDPSHHAELSSAIGRVREGLRGKTIKAAAVLSDDSIWMSFSDGTELRA